MKRFKSAGQAQRFGSINDRLADLFHLPRHEMRLHAMRVVAETFAPDVTVNDVAPPHETGQGLVLIARSNLVHDKINAVSPQSVTQEVCRLKTEFWYFDAFGAAPDVMKLGETVLRDPGPGEAVVALRAVGLNQAENRYLEGKHFPPGRFPACIGHEATGEIVAIGPASEGASRRWSVGDRVALAPMLIDIAGMGALRTLGLYKQSALVPVPENYSDVEGAAFWMGLFTVAGALKLAGLTQNNSQGKTILLTACTGGVGILGLKLARAWGMNCIATTRHGSKIGAITPLATHVAEVRSPEDLVSEVLGRCPDGIDAVIDPLGGRYVGAAIATLAPAGQYVGYEMVTGAIGEYDIMTMLSKGAIIRAFTINQLSQDRAAIAHLTKVGMTFAEAVTPVISKTFCFSEAPEAFATLQQGHHVGKIVITL